MSGNESAAGPASAEARRLLLGLCAGALVAAAYFASVPPAVSAPAAFALPPLLLACLWLAVRLARTGTTAAPAGLLAPGVAFFVGGAAFDAAATVCHTPDLAHEGNPVARALLDSGYPLGLVYGLAAVCQTLYVSLLCALWAALLRHRSFLLASLRDVRSPAVFLKAATGGRDLTWRQWMLPLRASELPAADCALWVLAVVLFAGGVDRWYLGCEWFGLVSGLRYAVVGAAVAAGLGVYLAWLWSASRPPAVVHTDGA